MKGSISNNGMLGCLAATLVCATLAWSFLFISFHDAKTVALWMGLMLFGVLRCFTVDGFLVGFRAWLPAWAGLATIGALSLARAEVPWLSAGEILRVSALLCFATLAYAPTQRASGRRVVLFSIVLSATLAAALALVQFGGHLRGLFPIFAHYDQPMYSVFGNQGLLGGYMALGLVILLGLLTFEDVHISTPFRIVAVVAALIMFSVLALSESRAGQLAFLAGVLALGFLSRYRIQRPLRTVAIRCPIGLLVLGLLVGGSREKWIGTFLAEDVGFQTRLWIGRASLSMATDFPLAGVGLGNYAYWIPQYMGRAVSGYSNEETTYHAHVDLLEFFCETGVLGLVFLSCLALSYRRQNPVAISGIIVFAVFSCFHPAWASLPHSLAATLLVGLNLDAVAWTRKLLPARWARPNFRYLLVAAILGGALAHGLVSLRPSFLLRRAEDLHLRGADGEAAYQAAVSGPGFRGEAHESFGIYLLEQHDYERAWAQFAAARREWDTGRLYFLQLKTAEKLGLDERARQLRDDVLARWPWAGELLRDPRIGTVEGEGVSPGPAS